MAYAGSKDTGSFRGQDEFERNYGGRRFTVGGKDHLGTFYDSSAEVVPQVTAFIDELESPQK